MMEARLTPPIMCPVLIGRVQELTTLRWLVDRVHGGEAQVALVCGEAGIGKSRLVAEVKASAAAHGFLLLEGQCFQTDSASPYAPLLDLFRAYVAWAPTFHADPMHSFASTLSRLLPDLALLFPDLASLPTPSSVNPEEEKRRLFAAMTHFVTEQAAQHPVLLVLEDLHWCDDLSLDLLRHLARRCRQVPLLLLVTYRSDELRPALRRWLAQPDWERLAHECSLERLSRAEVAAMLRAMLDLQQEVEADLLDTLYTRSEGNPFFVEELFKSLMTTGELVSVDGTWKRTTRRVPVPRSVQEAVQQRTAYLSADAKRLLTLAAVAGRRFNVTLLQEVMAAQLVIEEAADRFAFRHALTQQAIMASLLLRERQGLHRILAETLEQLSASSPASREAHQEALPLFEARADRQGMAQTLEMLGMAHFFMGDTARAVKDFYGRTIELFRSLGDRQSLCSILAMRALDSAPETLETTFSALLTREECVRDAEEALLLARQTNSSAEQAFVEMVTSYVLSSFGALGPALAHAQEALRIATAIEHQEWIVGTNGALGLLYLLLLEPDRAVACLEAALAGAQAMASAIQLKVLTSYLALAFIHRREFPRAEAVLKAVLLRDQEPGNLFERQVARVWGELALAQGETARALSIAEGLLVSAPGDMQQRIPHLLALKGEALLALKRLEEAAEAFEAAKLGAEERQAPSILWRIQRTLGQVYRLLKREERAQREWSEARDIIAKLAATIDETALREHFLRTALASLPQEKPLSQEALTSSRYGGLTAREREVAALVAQGRSNREIAAHLVVSERTAEVHVSNVLGKLGFTTRAQIAAWAVEKGLTTRLTT